MKLIKKFLIISAFSFLFIINTNALTNFTTHNLESLDNYLSNNPDKNENDYVNMIFDNIDLPSDEYLEENYIFTIDTTYSFVTLRYVSSPDLVHVAYNNNYGNPYLSFRSDTTSTYNFCSKVIQFDSQGNYSSSNNWSCSHNTSYTDTFFARNYNYYIIASNYETLSYKAPTWGQDSFSIDNGTQYQFNSDNIPIDFTNGNMYNFDVIDIFSAPDNPNKCLISNQIGDTRNISSLYFRVKGTTNALDYPLEGYFDMHSTAFIDRIDVLDYITYFDVLVNDIQSDDEYDVDYNLQWIEGTSSDILRLNYKITALDDIDTNIDVTFTIKPKDSTMEPFFTNQLLIFGCPPNNIYSNISYGYTNNDTGITYSSDSVLSNWLQNNSSGNISPLINTDLIGEGPVDSILLLPLNIMQNLLSVLNSNTCQPLVLPLPHLNRNITLPCVNTIYNQINGLSTFLNWFSTIISAFILYEYFIRLYKWVDNLLTFRENNHFGGF